MPKNYTICASCDIPSEHTLIDDLDLPICRHCLRLVLAFPGIFESILVQRAYIRSARVTVVDIPQPITPFRSNFGRKKWRRGPERARTTRGAH